MSLELNRPVSLQAGRSDEQIPYQDAFEAYQRNSNWWTVFATFDLPDFKPSPIWIAKKTALPMDEVVEALDGLVVLGFLKKEDGAFYPIKGKNFVEFNVANRSKAEVLDEHAVISQQVLNHLQPTALAAIDHRCFAGNKENLVQLYKDIEKAFDEAFKRSQECKTNDRVFKMTFTSVDVLSRNSNGREN